MSVPEVADMKVATTNKPTALKMEPIKRWRKTEIRFEDWKPKIAPLSGRHLPTLVWGQAKLSKTEKKRNRKKITLEKSTIKAEKTRKHEFSF